MKNIKAKKDKYNHNIFYSNYYLPLESPSNIKKKERERTRSVHRAHRRDIYLHYLDKESQMTSFYSKKRTEYTLEREEIHLR